MLYLYFLLVHLLSSTCARSCDFIKCSNTVDEVCGVTVYKDGETPKVGRHRNMCYLQLERCEHESISAIYPIDHRTCYIGKSAPEKSLIKRRQGTGSPEDETCYHSCPSSCPDTYDPACAQVWKDSKNFTYRPMINHCHIDLFSCSSTANVTIEPLSKCYKNPASLLLMQQVAALDSLDKIDDKWHEHLPHTQDDHSGYDHLLKEVIKGHLWKFRDPKEEMLSRRARKMGKRRNYSSTPSSTSTSTSSTTTLKTHYQPINILHSPGFESLLDKAQPSRKMMNNKFIKDKFKKRILADVLKQILKDSKQPVTKILDTS